MNAKQQAIKAAYGRYWDDVKKHVDANGWVLTHNMEAPDGILVQKAEDNYAWRPLSLKGIHNNNGWTRIDGPDDLPKEVGDYRFKRRDNKRNEVTHYIATRDADDFFSRFYTHWRPVEEVPDPVY